MGVFATTSFFSVFAYLWLYYCLQVSSPGQVTRVEAWITLGFFLLLLCLSYGADRYNSMKVEKMKS
jgi:solute carrier family 8 (sodium/calcium exchanger)